MEHVVLIIHLILAVALVIVVLLQRSEGAGLTGPSASGMMPVRGSANVLTRMTAVLAGGFMITSLALAALASHNHATQSLADTIANEEQQQTAPLTVTTPTAPEPENPAPPVSQ